MRQVKRPPQRGSAVAFVPAAVRKDHAFGIPGEHGSHRRPQFVLMPPREVQAEVARQTAVRRRDVKPEERVLSLCGFWRCC